MTNSAARSALAVVLGVAMLGIPAPLWAQATSTTFDHLARRLEEGGTIWVTDIDGGRHKGRLILAGPQWVIVDGRVEKGQTGLSLDVDREGKRFFAADRVLQVEVRSQQKVKMALLGLGAGAALGVLVGSRSEPDFIFSKADIVFLSGAVLGAIGAGIGACVGMQPVGKPRIIYRSQPAAGKLELAIAPVILPRAKGVALAVRF